MSGKENKGALTSDRRRPPRRARLLFLRGSYELTIDCILKCDETKPICRQCIKSRRHCSGYRSDFDILHRDETQATETRAKKAAAKKAAKRAAEFGGAFIQFEAVPAPAQRATQRATPPAVQALPAAVDAGGDSPSASTNSWTSPTSTALTTSSAFTSPLEVSFPVAAPSLPIDQHASHYFAAHFIMLPGEHGFKAGHLEYLVPLLQTETNSHGAFQLAYAACGLAAMSNREKADSTDLAHVAAMQHARACEAVARAIGDPVLRRSDATLAAVLLLIYFEVCRLWMSKESLSQRVNADYSRTENHRFERSRVGHMAVPYRRRHGACQGLGRENPTEQKFYEAVQRCAPANCALNPISFNHSRRNTDR